MSDTVLWHLPPSHYSEKVRWALDHKRVPHRRRAVLPPMHMAIALGLTRGRAFTVPVLELDGRGIADSSTIIAALEARFPNDALVPEEPADRSRALEIEEYFDETLGPAGRLLAFHHLRQDPDKLADFAVSLMPETVPRGEALRAIVGPFTSIFVQSRYRVASDGAATDAKARIHEAFDRLEGELDRAGGPHLVGDRFTSADLTAACMFIPIVGPAEGPALPSLTDEFEEFRAPFADRPGFRWVEQTFAEHRR